MSNKETVVYRSGGISVLSLLGVVFVTLKLLEVTAVATWSWWWVLAPFWAPIAIVIALFILFWGVVGVSFLSLGCAGWVLDKWRYR